MVASWRALAAHGSPSVVRSHTKKRSLSADTVEEGRSAATQRASGVVADAASAGVAWPAYAHGGEWMVFGGGGGGLAAVERIKKAQCDLWDAVHERQVARDAQRAA
jgi:hypothetical protein